MYLSISACYNVIMVEDIPWRGQHKELQPPLSTVPGARPLQEARRTATAPKNRVRAVFQLTQNDERKREQKKEKKG